MGCFRFKIIGLSLLLMSEGVHGQTADVFPPAAEKRKYQLHNINDASVVIDGVLDEAVWGMVEGAGDFYQIDPAQGAPPTFQTFVRMFYDDNAIYIGAVCYDSLGGKGLRSQGLRRDFEFFENDFFGINFDTFLDEKTSLSFQINPAGALRDIQVFEDVLFERNWNTVWQGETGITDSGWVVEIRIPWKSLRYPASRHEWGINFTRSIRRLNEFTAWSLYPRAFSGYRMDYAGRITGIDPPPAPLNLDIQPYILATDKNYKDIKGAKAEVGLDMKWAINPFSILDLTYNTDFAQAEVDNQVLNLTRFSLFFPEKRGFFLENERLFTSGWTNSFYPFFSRRIGLDAFGNPVSIDGGARFVSKSKERNIGALLIRQQETEYMPAANFGVLRIKEFLGNRSTIGALLTVRNEDRYNGVAGKTNYTFSADGFFRLSKTLSTDFTVSGSKTVLGKGDGFAVYNLINNTETWGTVGMINSVISANYNPEAGFLIRNDIYQMYPYIALNLRPAWKPAFVRSFEPGMYMFQYFQASTGKFQEGVWTVIPMIVRMNDNSTLETFVNMHRQNPERAFSLAGIGIAQDEYQYTRYAFRYASDQSYKYAGSMQGEWGNYYNGGLTQYSLSFRINPIPHILLAGTGTWNKFENVGINKETKEIYLLSPEIRLSLNPRVHLNLFYQYNSFTEIAAFNVRASYEFTPLSYIYLIVNDVKSNLTPYQVFDQQQVVLKINYLFRN